MRVSRAACTLCACVLLVCLVVPQSALSVGHEFIPPENWVYEALHRFETLGLVLLPTHELFTRDDIVVFADEIERTVTADGRQLSARDRFNLDRIRQEFTDTQSIGDPKARWNPPVLWMTEAPLSLEFDVDLGVRALKPLLDSKWAFFGDTQPTLRLHIGKYVTTEVRYRIVMGPERGDRARDQKPTPRTRSFKGMTALFERAYIIYRWKPLTLFWGRDYVDWGPAHDGNLQLSKSAGSVDRLGGRLIFKKLWLSSVHANLSATSERRLSGHRLEVQLKRFVLGVGESVVYSGRGIDPIYFLPFSAFYANQFNERNNDDNILWNFDIKWRVSDGVQLYAGYLIDDFQFERDAGTPDKTAWELGGRGAISRPFAATFRASYRRVDIYTYTHDDSVTGYYVTGSGDPDSGEVSIGALQGPDTDVVVAEVDVYPAASVTTTLLFSLIRRGEGNDWRKFDLGSDPEKPSFPSGVVEKRYRIGLRVLWELPRNTRLSGSVVPVYIENRDHQADVNGWEHAVALNFTWDFH